MILALMTCSPPGSSWRWWPAACCWCPHRLSQSAAPHRDQPQPPQAPRPPRTSPAEPSPAQHQTRVAAHRRGMRRRGVWGLGCGISTGGYDTALWAATWGPRPRVGLLGRRARPHGAAQATGQQPGFGGRGKGGMEQQAGWGGGGFPNNSGYGASPRRCPGPDRSWKTGLAAAIDWDG